ncbi:MAG: peptidoglycan DD-metalloendopeptidase family protein [Acidiferrobacter sp.]
MRWPLSVAAIALVALGGCSATIPAPIHDDSASLIESVHSYHVLPGDTLYSIAFETGHDYRQLAHWNGIRPPYRIMVGETLRLDPAPRYAAGRPLRVPEETLRRARVAPRALRGTLNGRPSVAPQIPVRPVTLPSRSIKSRLQRVKSWIWPARGLAEDTFGRGLVNGRPGNKGIDIIGHYGEPIHAAAAGRIVYVGSGLPGYGELIIIKHNNDYLSAYAHNAHVDVKEGAMVQQGEVIATMGDSGTDRVELDFEIRKRGIAVNPMRYLPQTHH